MSILIKGMKMPKSCVKCHWYYECYDEHCTLGRFLLRKYTTDVSEESYILDVQRHPDCPLVEIPTPHGRLIDGDELISDLRIYESKYCGEQGYITQDDIIDAPTIIEAKE